jgi:CheY-like chemotaxis protein
MSHTPNPLAGRTPTVYFIDDSATMREVIKIAFRKEQFSIVACADAASALAQFEQTPPDAVITDVIMPDKDGYEVCHFVKQHQRFARTPVILMSGVVNQSVAEKATAVRADELIRKPFQPHELIARVKSLLAPKFGPIVSVAPAASPAPTEDVAPRAPSNGVANHSSSAAANGNPLNRLFAPAAGTTPAAPPARPVASPAQTPTGPASSAEVQKLRNDIRRLELLVKKLRAELEAEKQYSAAIESQLQETQ